MGSLKKLKKIAKIKGISLKECAKDDVIDFFLSKCIKHKIPLDESVCESMKIFWEKDYIEGLKNIINK